jgi:NitT/TauT family transport system substrate-binding protein
MKPCPRQLLTAASALLWLAGCTPPEPPAEPPGAAAPATTATATEPLRTLTVCHSSVSSTQSVPHYAAAKGLFAKHGLDVDLVLIDGGSKAATALVAGDVDLCQLAGSAAINAVVAGAPVKVVGGLYNTYIYSLMVTPAVRTAADLQGKKLAISSVGGSSDFAIRQAVEHLGLAPDRDVQILAVGGQAERMAAMLSGQVDGTLVSVPETVKAREAGFHELLDMSALGVPYQHTALVAREDFLAQDRPTALRFMKAISEAAWQMKQDREGALDVLAELLALDPVADREALEETFDGLIVKYLQTVPRPTLPGIRQAIVELAAENPEAAGARDVDVADESLVDELEHSGFFAALEQGGHVRP